LASDEEVRFLRVAGSNPTPLEPLLTSRTESKTFGVREKLCGNELGNFAAFFSAKWRVNDWMWGRLDAVKSIVDLLVRPERLFASGIDAATMVKTVRTLANTSGMTLADGVVAQIDQEIGAAILYERSDLDMTTTRATLTEAMQRRIFAELLPLISEVGEHPIWPEEVKGPSSALSTEESTDLDRRIAGHHVGAQSIGDLDSRRRTQIGMRLAMVTYLAVKPERRSGHSRPIRGLMLLLKPLYLFVSFAALNFARAMFLVTVTAVGFLVGPWRLRKELSRGGRGWEIFSYRTLPWDSGQWWPRPVRPSSVWAWVEAGLLVILGIASLALFLRNVRQRRAAKRSGRAIPDGRIWYLSAFLFVVATLGCFATGICVGPIGSMLGSGLVACCASRWMRRGRSWLMGVLTMIAYAVTGLAFWGFTEWVRAGQGWFGYTGWMSVVALCAAAGLITIWCTCFRVVPTGDEIRKAARRTVNSVS
jgi:hypothetical protein